MSPSVHVLIAFYYIFLKGVPELRSVVGEAAAAELSKVDSVGDQASLKRCFTALMSSKDDLIREQLSCLVSRLQKASKYAR